jgi:meso-butanediol dehydrogenase/(S,S)-butanediol dehydrogenase/diacetyl reductase
MSANMPSSGSLQGRVALVTGSGRVGGIGAAIAVDLARAGADVAVVDLSRSAAAPWSELEAVADLIRAEGRRALVLTADVRIDADCDAAVEQSYSQLGGCDILVNNAAAPHGDARNDIAAIPTAAWDLTLETNLRGTFLLTRAAIPGMRARGWGRIVNMASVGAFRGVRNRSAYNSSKAGIVGFTQSVAMDVADAGITVNAVCPGMIHTPRNYEAPGTKDGHGTRAMFGGAPLGRAGTPDDVAYAVTFLASDRSAYITGQTITVDGGLGTALTPARRNPQ